MKITVNGNPRSRVSKCVESSSCSDTNELNCVCRPNTKPRDRKASFLFGSWSPYSYSKGRIWRQYSLRWGFLEEYIGFNSQQYSILSVRLKGKGTKYKPWPLQCAVRMCLIMIRSRNKWPLHVHLWQWKNSPELGNRSVAKHNSWKDWYQL